MQQLTIRNSSFLTKVIDLFSQGCAYDRTDWNWKGIPLYSTINIFTYATVPDGSRRFRLSWTKDVNQDGSEISSIFLIHPLSVNGSIEGYRAVEHDRREGNISVYEDKILAIPYIEDTNGSLVKKWIDDLSIANFDPKRTLFYALKDHSAGGEIKFGKYLYRDGTFVFSESNYRPPERRF